MVVRIVEILTEYIAIILCIHKIADKKIKFHRLIVLLFMLEVSIIMMIDLWGISRGYELIVFAGIFLFVKNKIANRWSKAIEVYGISLVCITILQMILYWIFKVMNIGVMRTQYGGAMINGTICLGILKWKNRYWNIFIEKGKRHKGTILILICMISLFLLLFIYNAGKEVNYTLAMQFVIGIIGLSIVSVWWINAESESYYKTKELQIYKTYNQAFEEAIKTIRSRQHEFENHINAIRCMQYTISDSKELVKEQERYCKKILDDNAVNKLLSLNLEPILVGFLYSKITEAQNKGIYTLCDICFSNNVFKMELYELIELLGILFDNAIEALSETEEEKNIILRMRDEEDVIIEVANISRVYKNSEIEKFCMYGYSTKDKKRGIGLTRVRDIVQKYEAILFIENCEYKNSNYLCFKIVKNNMKM